MTTLKRTPLYDWHIKHNAKMVDFSGYAMPVQYQGVIQEHGATRQSAGFFDVSHMGKLWIEGPQVAEALEVFVPCDVLGLANNRQVYTALLNEQGGVIDDVMLARVSRDQFLMVVNASRQTQVMDHLSDLRSQGITVKWLIDFSLLAVQGPCASQVLQTLDMPVAAMRFMDVFPITVDGQSGWCSRSGYTGEDGFELCLPQRVTQSWVDRLMATNHVTPAGLGARDTLRLEAGLCLYGHELNEQVTLAQAGLSWVVQPTRRIGGQREGGFIGAKVTLNDNKQATNRIGLIADSNIPVRQRSILEDADGNTIGSVTSGSFSPTLKKPIAMAYLDMPAWANFQHQDKPMVFACVRKHRVPMRPHKLPFVPHRYHR